MTTAAIVIGVLLLLAMVGISVYGAITLPSDARIPLHYGIGSYGNFASKTVGLIMWPVGGAGDLRDIRRGVRARHQAEPLGAVPDTFIMVVVLVLVVALEYGAISLARGRTTARSE